MFLSIFDVFKIGVGPSSSHTMGPMTAAARFLDALRGGAERIPGAGDVAAVEARLHGALAFTGRGHATDRAVILGLSGAQPDTLDPDNVDAMLAEVTRTKRVCPPDLPPLAFDPDTDLVFDYDTTLPGHANGMVPIARDAAGAPYFRETYYSIGGGFVMTEAELTAADNSPGDLHADKATHGYPYPFGSATEMLAMGARHGLSVAEMKRANETAHAPGIDLDRALDRLAETMFSVIDRGLSQQGILPGGLGVQRRAKAVHDQLLAEQGLNATQPHVVNDRLSVYAMAVNEENAAGARVVTAPTNGAAGVVPAVLRYYRDHCLGANTAGLRDLLLTAAAIGGLIKHRASISGAEVGCQGEVGAA